MTDQHQARFYMIGMLDILGQRRKLAAPTSTQLSIIEELQHTAQGLDETVAAVKRLRELFDENIENYAKSQSTATPKIVSWGMSDALVIAVPLGRPETDTAIADAMTDVLVCLSTMAFVWLVSLAHECPIRGGVEIGTAVPIGEREVYGPALAAAYHLESKVAKGPRIVAGDRLVRFLWDARQRHDGDPNIEKAARRATNTLALMQDYGDGDYGDGKIVLDGFAMAKNIPLAREMFDRATDYVGSQLDVHKKSGDDELLSRYRALLAHFKRGLP